MTLPGRRSVTGHARQGEERGFTLIELLIVVTILPLVIGAISLGLVSVFSLQSRVSARLSGSGDLQTVDATFVKDVQSAGTITTEATTPPECGTNGTQLLGLVWSDGQSAVSYVSVPVNNGTTNYSLERTYCTFGNFTTPVRTTVISYDLSGSQSAPSICAPSYSTCSSSLLPPTAASTIAAVVFPIYVPMSSAPYTMVASPRAGGDTAGGAPTGNSKVPPLDLLGSGCGVLAVGNGSLSINVNGGTANGNLGINSTCTNGAVTVDNNGSINAATILAPNPSSSTISTSGNPGYVPPVYGWAAPSDPFVGLTPPQAPASTSPGSCTMTGKKTAATYTCSPGYYANNVYDGTTAGFKNNSTIIFSGGGNYYFAQDFNLPNGSTTTFSTGAYIFAAPDQGAFTTGTNGITVYGNNALFYVPNGSLTFQNNSIIDLTPPKNWLGSNGDTITSDNVTIWDGGTCSSYAVSSGCAGGVVTLGNNGSQTNSFGGIYVPSGGVVDNENGTIDTAFIVASWASFLNGLNINIGL